jgi:hypothetical protein
VKESSPLVFPVAGQACQKAHWGSRHKRECKDVAFKALMGMIMPPTGQAFLRRISLTPDPGDAKMLDKLIAVTWTCRARGETVAVNLHFTALSARAILARGSGSEEERLARLMRRAMDELGLPAAPLGDGFAVRPRLGCLIRLNDMGKAEEALRLSRLWGPRVEREVDRPATVFAFLKNHAMAAVKAAGEGEREPARWVRSSGDSVESCGLSRAAHVASEAHPHPKSHWRGGHA